MKEFKDFLCDVEKGMIGENLGIPTGFDIVDQNTSGIQKSIYTLIGGLSGSGKTSLVDEMFVLNPYDWLQSNESNFKLKIIYNSMERSAKYKIGKWVCLKLFKDYRIILDVPTIFGWRGKKRDLTTEEKDLIYKSQEYFEKMSDIVTIYERAENPTGIYNKCISFLKQNGKIEKTGEYSSKYIPNNSNLIVLIINDHVGKMKLEMGYNDKENLDKHSEYMGILRDFYYCSPIDISQFNRSLSNIERFKHKDLSPEPDDFKGSSDLYENADRVYGLFNPFKFKIDDFIGYDIKKFISPNGENRFRSLSIIKNTYGVDDIIIGLNFLGECGHFRELPTANYFKNNPQKYLIARDFIETNDEKKKRLKI